MDLEALNQRIRRCTDCTLSATRTQAICGEGNPRARVMVVAQAPGETEDREGRMFIGPSGRALDELLDAAQVDRGVLYITNLVKCMLPGNRRPKEREVEACSRHLEEEIDAVDPRVIVTLGYRATRYVLERYAIPLPQGSELTEVYGNLFLARWRKVYPLPHPAALLHEGTDRGEIFEAYRKIAVLLEDCWWYPGCPMRRYHEMGELGREWIEPYCKGDWEGCTRYRMEERGEPHPDWMLPDGSIDERLRRVQQRVM